MLVVMGASIPLRIESALVHRARTAAVLADRTPTAQIEHWAKLGIALEPVLSGRTVSRVKQAARIKDLDQIVAISQTAAGQERVRALIQKQGGPVYEADPEDPALVVERRPDGTVRRGRFENRQFKPVGRKAGKSGAQP
ncbi:MAG TPA: hypothetical protein PK879_10620 [Opitutaceae bacterium]|nr:hypothetical protein [Opitutaceae bacterium]